MGLDVLLAGADPLVEALGSLFKRFVVVRNPKRALGEHDLREEDVHGSGVSFAGAKDSLNEGCKFVGRIV